MSGQRSKRFRRAQVLAMLNMLDEEDSGRSDAKNQENNCYWELSVSEEELSSEDEVENVPNLCATNDASTTLLVMSNSDLSAISSNPSIADRQQWKRQQTMELNRCFEILVPMKEGDELRTMYSQNNWVYLGGA